MTCSTQFSRLTIMARLPDATMRKLLLVALCLLPSASLAQTRPAITGIAFMRVYTDDIEAARHFYGDTMGYEENRFGDELVFPINKHQWVEVVPSKARDGQSYLAAIGFSVSNLDAMKRYLVARGITDFDGAQAGSLALHDPE